ncbi:MAG: glycosyltransferase family 4 protein [Acidimicrobiales bacterium]
MNRPAPVRVALDATAVLGTPTGVGRVVAGILAALAIRQDIDLVGYGLTWNGRRQLGPALPPGVAVARRAMVARPLIEAWAHLDHPRIERWAGSLDVVHGTNFVVPPARAARVVTVYDLTAVRFPELCTPAARRYPALVRRALGAGAVVHTLSAWVAGEVVELLGADPGQVRVIPPGIGRSPGDVAPSPPASFGRIQPFGRILSSYGRKRPNGQIRPNVAGAGSAGSAGRGESDGRGGSGGRAGSEVGPTGRLARPGAPPGPPYILALGTAEPRKDLPGLVRAFDSLAGEVPEVELQIAGPPGWGQAELDQAIAGAAHRRRIVRLGWVPDPAALVAGAALLAYPSLYEGFGFPPLEAMAAGVPVVATSAGAVPEVAGGAARLVPPGDPDALAEAMGQVLSDQAERRRLVEAGRRRVAVFSWDAAGDALARLYQELAGR